MLRYFSGTQRMERDSTITDMRQRINAMQEAIQPMLTDDKVRTARWEDWKYNLIHAAWREQGNKRGFYRLRVVSITSSITVPSLVGLNLAGTGGAAVRWITFALGLVAAIATGYLTLYRTGDRWLMYRRLTDSLLVIGYTLVDSFSTDPGREQSAWKIFTSATDSAVAQYNRTYEVTVIHASQGSAEKSGEVAKT